MNIYIDILIKYVVFLGQFRFDLIFFYSFDRTQNIIFETNLSNTLIMQLEVPIYSHSIFLVSKKRTVLDYACTWL